MKNEKESKLENDQGAIQLERFIQMKREENKALQKLLKAIQKEQEKITN